MKSEKTGLYFGSVEFSGFGGFQEKMLSQLLENGVAVKKVTFSEGRIIGFVSPLDYFKTAEIARKNGVKLRAKKRGGLYFTLSKYRFRAGIYVGILVFLMLISIKQTQIRDIKITGDVAHGQIMQILEECGIKKGAFADSLSLSKAEYKIMLDVENCAWTDVSCEGFRVNVRVEKGVEMPELEDGLPRNVVAARPAKIVRQVVRKGASVLNNGSGVNTGDLLVSGTVPDGRDKVLFVRADAEIIGEWNETAEFFVPYTETVSVANGEKKVFKYLVLGDDEYPLFFGRAFAENSVYTEETQLVMMFGEPTPLKIKSGVFTAYTSQNITRSPESAASELRKQKENYERNFYSDYDIIAVEEKFLPEETGIRLILEYTLQGDIAKPVVIEMGGSAPEAAPAAPPDQPES